MNVNLILMTGRLTRNPELRYTQNGTAVVNFVIAQNEKTKDGKEKAQFIECSAFHTVAENMTKMLTKGQLVYVEGRLQINKYVDKNGQNRERAQIAVNKFMTFAKPAQTDEDAQPELPVENVQPTLTSHEFAEDVPW